MFPVLRFIIEPYRHDFRSRTVWSMVVAVLSTFTLPAITDAEDEIILRHQTTTGIMTLYEVHIETARWDKDQSAEAVRQEIQTGKLTRIIFSAQEKGQSNCAQMLELKAATTTTKPAKTQPTSRRSFQPLVTSPARVQFSVGPITDRQAPLIVPAKATWPKAMLKLIMDVTHWPKKAVTAGSEWKLEFQFGKIDGEQKIRVAQIKSIGEDRRITINVSTETKSSIPPTDGQLISAESKLVWSIQGNSLIKFAGRVAYQEPIRIGGQMVEIQVTIWRTGQPKKIPRSQLVAERKWVIRLTNAIGAYRREDYQSATRTLAIFQKRRKASIFKPMADYLLRLIKNEQASNEPLPLEELKPALVRLLTAWEEAESDSNMELLNRHTKSLQQLAKINRPEITRLLDDEDGRLRALGCFALSFGGAPADVALIQNLCDDTDLRTRRTALYALSIRASPHTDAKKLLTALDDHDQTIRQRACEAIAKCVAKDSDDIQAVRDVLVKRLNDDSSAVILAAAQALIRIGSPTEIEKIKQASEKTKSETLKDALQKLVSTYKQQE